MANYGFRITTNTIGAMSKYKSLIKNVSSERIAEELFKILSVPDSFSAIKKMSQLRIIDEIIPHIDKERGVFQGSYHHLGVWEHSLETLRQFEALCRKKLVRDKDIFKYLNQELVQGRKMMQLLKLACLLHDIGKPSAKKEKNKKTIFHTHEKIGRDLCEEISLRLRLSFRETEVLKKLIYWHLRPGYLADQAQPSKRAIYRFFNDAKSEGVAVILLSLSDWRATRGPLTNEKKRKKHERVMFKLIEHYFQEAKKVPLSKIIDGHDIMRKFKLKPSTLIGKILKKIKEEQTLGKISTKNQAYCLARKVIDKR